VSEKWDRGENRNFTGPRTPCYTRGGGGTKENEGNWAQTRRSNSFWSQRVCPKATFMKDLRSKSFINHPFPHTFSKDFELWSGEDRRAS
jgi:hypothetical protein